MTDTTQQFLDYPSKNAFRHKLPSDEARESLAHMIIIPERGAAAYLYPAVLGNGQAKAVASALGGPFDEQIFEVSEAQMSPDMGFEDWRVGNFHMQVLEPFKRVALKWDGDRIKVDGEFEALHPPYGFSTHPDGNPPYYGDDRTEQHGRFRGKITLDGDAFDYDGLMVRDHSWGPRIWGVNQHYKWVHATTGEESMHFFEMHAFGRVTMQGFLFKDGKMAHLAKVEPTYGFDKDMIQKDFRVTVTDTEGRQATIAYDIYRFLISAYDPKTVINTGYATVEFDGKPGVGICEFNWNRDYFDYVKKYAEEFG